jgi:hypothetical protein
MDNAGGSPVFMAPKEMMLRSNSCKSFMTFGRLVQDLGWLLVTLILFIEMKTRTIQI